MNTLDLIKQYAVRGACRCGKCYDREANADALQPEGHTVNMTFYKVAMNEGLTRKVFEDVVRQEYPQLFDGEEHNYIELGGVIGDQNTAIMLIGLGALVGAWDALTPDTLMPFVPENIKQQMAGGGMVALKVKAV